MAPLTVEDRLLIKKTLQIEKGMNVVKMIVECPSSLFFNLGRSSARGILSEHQEH